MASGTWCFRGFDTVGMLCARKDLYGIAFCEGYVTVSNLEPVESFCLARPHQQLWSRP